MKIIKESDSSNKVELTLKSGEIYILWNEMGVIKGTGEENYNARIRNERKVNRFDSFTMEEAVEYVKKYFDK